MTRNKLLWTILTVSSLYVWWSFFAGRVHALYRRGFSMAAIARWENPCAYWFIWGVYFAAWVVMLVKIVPAL